jgi:hypothetical protein
MPGASEQTSQVKVLNIVGTWLAPTGLTRVAVATPGQ